MTKLRMQSSCLKVPKNFKPVRYPERVRVVAPPAFSCGSGPRKGIRKKGLVYEYRVGNFLDQCLPVKGISAKGVWFEFYEYENKRYAQLDWLGFDMAQGVLYLVEVKLTRVAKAWWQLNKLYMPLLKEVFPGWDIALIEVASRVQKVEIPARVRAITELTAARPGETSFLQVPYETA